MIGFKEENFGKLLGVSNGERVYNDTIRLLMGKTIANHKTVLNLRNGEEDTDSDESLISFRWSISISVTYLDRANRAGSCADDSDRTESDTSSHFYCESSCDSDKYKADGPN